MTLLAKMWAGLKALPGLIFPFLGKAATLRGLSPWLRWTLHAVFLALLLGFLTYLNWLFDLEKVLRTPLGFLRKIWLPLLVFLIYLLGWLGWWLRKLLGPEEKSSAFPDIDAAWAEALEALDKAGIDLSEAPLFVVLGQPQSTEESLFAAADLPLQVRHVPRRPTAPLHLYASRDGIYLTCGGASLLARQTALLTEEVVEEEGGARAAAPPVPEVPASDAAKRTLHWHAVAGQKAAGVSTAPAAAPFEMSPSRARRNRLLLADDEAEILTARLEHLGRLIVRERRPYCPANGILVLLPWAVSGTDNDAQQTARLCQRDLTALRQVLRVQCPVFALVSDLDRAAGFRELIARLPPGQRQQRLGRSFPLAPDLTAEQLPEMIQDGIRWACDTLFPNLIYRLLALDATEQGPEAPAVVGNARLYQLLGELRARRQRLGDLLRRAVVRPERGATLFGGCYFAGTGRDPANEHAFCAGVFPLLQDNQNFVSWTPEALAEEMKLRRGTVYGYAALAVLAILLLVAAYFFWPS